MKKETKEMIKRLEHAGLQVTFAKGRSGGHFRVLDAQGRFVSIMAQTPSDIRSYRNLVAQVFRSTGIRV